jgi:hypothetical protein
MKMTKEILYQVEDGIIPNDKDLDIAIDFYQTTTDNLALLGEKFHLSWKECFFKLKMLQEFKTSRKNRLNNC